MNKENLIKVTSILLFSVLIVSCGSSPTKYQPKEITIEEAYEISEEMIYTQHPKWRPDNFVVTDKYIGFDYGTVTRGRVSGSVIGDTGFFVGSSKSTTRGTGERYYYRNIASVKLLSWKRKFQQWWVVSLYDENDHYIRHILRTRSYSDAKLFTDALHKIVNTHKKTI